MLGKKSKDRPYLLPFTKTLINLAGLKKLNVKNHKTIRENTEE